jgi:ferrochelatase
MTAQDGKPIGVILLNMGGPEKLDEVEPFLYNLFSDRQIIRLGPFFMQKFLARMISRKRAPKSMETYRLIGGGSPLTRLTNEQAAALQKELIKSGNFLVRVAMRYWPPYADKVLVEFQKHGIEKVIAVSLYPHYSKATGGSSLRGLQQAVSKAGSYFEVVEVASWPAQPKYIACLADNINKGLEQFDGDVQVVYSAHSLPVKFIEEGDLYLDHLKVTIRAVEEITGHKGELCFQSRSGPVEWLSPSTPEKMKELARKGCKNILMVPISFVSDHVETLYEIDMMYREQAADLGMRLERTESMNSNPLFIEALKELVLEKI